MNKPIFPDAVRSRLIYPFFGDARLNLWGWSAIVLAVAARWCFHQPWSLGWPAKCLIALVPLVPVCLYSQRLIRWTHELDEMQRRIQVEACWFAAAWTVFLRMALDVLAEANRGPLPYLNFGLGIEGSFVVMIPFYLLGCVLANRRYQ